MGQGAKITHNINIINVNPINIFKNQDISKETWLKDK